MTNPASGSKRQLEDSDSHQDAHKRQRDEPKDWKEVHLNSPRHRSGGRRRGGDDRRGSRGPGPDRSDRRASDYGQERSRRDDRSRERNRQRDRGFDRDRYRPRENRDGRADSRHRRDSRERRSSPRANDHTAARAADTEKEEGEISPPGTPLPPTRPSNAPIKKTPSPPPPEPELELDLGSGPPVEDTLAARRARRQAILAKYTGISSVGQSASPSPGPSSAADPHPPPSVLSDLPSQPQSAAPASTAASTAAVTPVVEAGESTSNGLPNRRSVSAEPEPDVFELIKDDEEGDVQADAQAENAQNGAIEMSAADYDQILDRREDEEKRVRGGTKDQAANGDIEMVEAEEEEEEDAEDVDDMFALLTTDKKKVKKIKKVAPSIPALITTTIDNAADSEGYYQVILGEQLDGGRYQVFSVLGKGMFANVVRARVLQQDDGESNTEVAIKITRSQESMFKAGLKEVAILNKLKQADPEDKKHIVRLERTFEHRGHLCLVFESMSMNLRDVVKRFGKDVGLNIKAVRAYAHQLFLALSLLRKCNLMHADIKPDNILVNEAKTMLKLCDLGSASDVSENEVTPYLVSRFYRAPEIIMGVPYDASIDIWSIGCTLYELYTGKILFPGRSNNQMILHMMELKGRFNSKIIKKAQFGDVYFDSMGAFNSIEQDRVTGANVMRAVHIQKPSRDLKARLMPPSSVKLKDEESKLLSSFIDLLDKCLALDPARRISPREALVHPFIRG